MINPTSRVQLDLEKLKTSCFHFIGVGGSGMAPIANTLALKGHSVSGSDIRLLNTSLQTQQGHDPNLIKKADIVVVSSAIRETNAELIWATENNLVIAHRSDVLNALLNSGKLSIGICGTSGKTTTTGLCISALSEFAPKPVGVCGATSKGIKSQPEEIQAPYTLVAELDESDGSLVKYAPTCLVVHNIDRDHMGTYGCEEKIAEAFLQTALNLPAKASLVVNWDHPKCRKLYRQVEQSRNDLTLVSYGKSMGSEVRLLNRSVEGTKQKISVQCQYETLSIEVPGVGEFMVSNTLAALAGTTALGQSPQKAAKGIESFGGLSRRMELLQKDDHSVIYSDYAHNPEKICAAISGIKEAFPEKKICAFFQPHRYTRTVELWKDFLESFRKVDDLYLLPIFSAGEAEPGGFSLQDFCTEIQNSSNCKTRLFTNTEFSSLAWLNESSEKTAYIALGAGDIHSMLTLALNG